MYIYHLVMVCVHIVTATSHSLGFGLQNRYVSHTTLKS